MPVSGGRFEQAYNAQAAVDTNSMPVIAPAVTPACNDRERVKPMLDQLTQLPAALGKIEYLLTDNDFYPENLEKYATSIIGWKADSVIDALERKCQFQNPDGTPSPKTSGGPVRHSRNSADGMCCRSEPRPE
ncbi:MAG: hypothetical protein HS120_05950 [Burkholderiales bacterium]|nr:hypothetical protein [Burkholderiales bacterium]